MTDRPRLVYLLRHYPQLSQTFVRNEIAGLRALGHEVTVFSLRASDTSHVDPRWAGPYERWPVVSAAQGARALGWWFLHHPLCTMRMLAAAHELGFSDRRRLTLLEVPAVARRLTAAGPVAAVHTHFVWTLNLEPTVLLARLLGARSSVTSHAVDIYLPAPTLPRVLRLVDTMVTVCRYNVGELVRTGLWPAGRPEPLVVPCGVEVPAAVDRPSSGVTPRVVSVGRLVEKKGFADLVTAMGEVVRHVPGARLEIIGDGPQREQLERQVASLGLGSVVALLGPAPHREVLEAVSGAGVFALACRVDSTGDSDAVPVVIREAMVRSVPVVTTDVAGIGENVDASCGWLVPPGDPTALSAAIVEALVRPDVADERARAGRERVIDGASTEATARSMSDVLGGDTAGRTPSPAPQPLMPATGAGGHRYSVVTVFYEGDLPLLHLQARSMALYAAPGLFEAVVVIDNTRSGLSGRSVRHLLRDYGSLGPLVRVVRAGSLAALPPMTGWWSQQVLKLAVARMLATDRYLVLDAKNLVVDALDLDFLQAPDGRARLFPSSFVDHPLRPKLETTLRYLGIDPDLWVDGFGSTVTPFVMETSVVRELVDTVEQRSGRSLGEEMITHGLTEFFLYQGWIVARGRALHEVHTMDRVRCPAVWPSGADAMTLRCQVAQARDSHVPVFTVHQRALVRFDAERVAVLGSFWTERGLFASSGAARTFMTRFQRSWSWRSRRGSARRALTSLVRRATRTGRKASSRPA